MVSETPTQNTVEDAQKAHSIRIFAPIDVQEEVASDKREKAAVLAFPEEKQGDLQYIRSILVSAGTNKNGAHFLPSEMMRAHNTIVNKAIDIEHEEDKVIGHIYDCAYLFKNGEPFDPNKLMAEYSASGQDPDTLDIDIAVAGIIHKLRFPEIAEEISQGLWKVSMECLFKDFDLKIGGQILSKQEALALGYDPSSLVGGFVKVIAGNKTLGKHFVARVLRDIRFIGMGVVRDPANPHSIIMETAAYKEQVSKDNPVIDLEQIDNLRGNNRINLTSDTESREAASDTSSVVPATPVLDEATGERIYIELDHEHGGIKRILTVSEKGKEEGAIRFTGPGIGPPGSVLSFPDSTCKSFKKRVTRFNALDQSESQIIHEHWCALFEEPCPVIGASAKAPECLRNIRNRTIRDDQDNTLTKTIREHVTRGPANTFTTILSQPIITKEESSATSSPSELLAKARALRKSLRDYVDSSRTRKKISGEPLESYAVVTPSKVLMFDRKVDAFKSARALAPNAERASASGFVLFVGPEPRVISAGEDREAAIDKAVSLAEKTESTVILGKVQSSLAENTIVKNQLLFSSK